MTSLNKLKSPKGSALVVTMLLVSVLLTAALILLQRIVPYAKSVRSMHDASQAYYTARGEVELGRLGFFYIWWGASTPQQAFLRVPTLFGLLGVNQLLNVTTSGTQSLEPTVKRTNSENITRIGTVEIDQGTGIRTEKLLLPVLNDLSDHVVTSVVPQAPLRIKLFEKDSTPKRFGTSKKNADYHTLYSRNAGGLRFDLRGVDTDSIASSSFRLNFPVPYSSPAKITLKMQYYNGWSTDVKTFTAEYPLSLGQLDLAWSTTVGNIQVIDQYWAVSAPTSASLLSFLQNNDCSTATICSLSLILSGVESIDFRIISDTVAIPDLNAVVIGDGLSKNRLYYQRIIDLIPTPQDI